MPPVDHKTFEKVLLKHAYEPGAARLEHYLSHGGYEGARKAISSFAPDQLIEYVKSLSDGSELRR